MSAPTFPWLVSFRGPDTRVLAGAVSEVVALMGERPESYREGMRRLAPGSDLRKFAWPPGAIAEWPRTSEVADNRTRTTSLGNAFNPYSLARAVAVTSLPGVLAVQARRIVVPRSPSDFLGAIAELPFFSAVGDAIYDEWTTDVRDRQRVPELFMPRAGLGGGHYDHGWCVAFKGLGHVHLGCRRELLWNPWRVLRDETHDVTLVQFHDLAADPVTAASQARPGHELMGYTLLPVGIYFHGGEGMYEVAEHHPFSFDLTGDYDAATRTLRIRRDRGLFPREVTDFAAHRWYSRRTAQPIDRVQVEFSREDLARQFLNILWHREIEVWHASGGEAVRIDEGFEPPPYDPPDWVKEVQDREGV